MKALIAPLSRVRIPILLLLVSLVSLFAAGPAAAQSDSGRVQRLTERLEAGDADAYLVRNLQPGDRLTVSMRTTSGNLDPLVGISDTALTAAELRTEYVAAVQSAIAADEDVSLSLNGVRDQYFLAWDDDGGDGYSSYLEYTIPAAGDYRITTAAALSSLGRSTFGDYELLVGLNADDLSRPAGEAFVEREAEIDGLPPSVEEATGSVTAENPTTTFRLDDIPFGHTLYVSVAATSGNLVPVIVLRDYGGKPVEAGNLDGQDARATLRYAFDETSTGYTLDVSAAEGADGAPTTGDFRAVIGLNEPDVLAGTATVTGDTLLQKPIDVKVGVRLERISEVDSQGEDFTILGSVRMDWQDPALAFSPDSCNCEAKVYSEKEFDKFLADVGSRWPDFVFFNQQGNRWTQSRAAILWPDGRARYGETFTTTFQGDFDFKKFPFDTQYFPIFLDMLYPVDTYTLSELPGYSEINPEHGEDEFIVGDLAISFEPVTGRIAELPVSRATFGFEAPRHLNYYMLQVFVPILLIVLISWFTFFLKDYTRRIEASAANILLFIAFSFSLADNYPRLGYITFLDAVMAVTFIFNTLVLLYNVVMKRLENENRQEKYEYIDRFFDWAYPFLYFGLIGVVALVMLR